MFTNKNTLIILVVYIYVIRIRGKNRLPAKRSMDGLVPAIAEASARANAC